MTEQVLTDEEKSALLDGVESGAIEVQSSSGPQYASVAPFTIGPRSRIAKNTYPRLKLMHDQLAERLGNAVEQLLHGEVEIGQVAQSVQPFNDACESSESASLVIEFEAPPLPGVGLLVFEETMVRNLVESFFGGSGNGEAALPPGTFTPGELAVSRLFGDVILGAIRDVWDSLLEFKPKLAGVELSLELVNSVAETDPVLGTRFEFKSEEFCSTFHVLWPLATVESLLPALAGEKKERDPAEVARWGEAIRGKLPETVVTLTSTVGYAHMTLGELVDLAPGDIIDFNEPQRATLQTKRVPLIEGRFGVHAGCNAVETERWIAVDPDEAQTARKS